mmetsp:Transcript_25405/g.62506  ORF Transcript_25405/g.62506 Transcript_25405/m.62506 type:complete len:327 (+) Transcript_25405:774-1754(+)
MSSWEGIFFSPTGVKCSKNVSSNGISSCDVSSETCIASVAAPCLVATALANFAMFCRTVFDKASALGTALIRNSSLIISGRRIHSAMNRKTGFRSLSMASRSASLLGANAPFGPPNEFSFALLLALSSWIESYFSTAKSEAFLSSEMAAPTTKSASAVDFVNKTFITNLSALSSQLLLAFMLPDAIDTAASTALLRVCTSSRWNAESRIVSSTVTARFSAACLEAWRDAVAAIVCCEPLRSASIAFLETSSVSHMALRSSNVDFFTIGMAPICCCMDPERCAAVRFRSLSVGLSLARSPLCRKDPTNRSRLVPYFLHGSLPFPGSS